jgi:hypothetical protein
VSDHVDFAELFQGNPCAHGTVEGGCVRSAPDFGAHLFQPDRSIGIYPMVESAVLRKQFLSVHGVDGGAWYVRWGCTDIDNADDPEACLPLARNLWKVLRRLGITSWVERTKGKGYHVWVFAQEWVPAIVMRRALLAAHQVAGVKPTEVNPKQVDTTGIKAGLGNYVNLPYPCLWEDAGRRVVIDPWDGYPRTLPEFLDDAMHGRTPYDTLYAAAKLYIAPPPVRAVAYTEPSVEAATLARNLPGLPYTIWKNGCLEGRDRSTTMARFCHLCAEASIDPGDCMVMLRDLDARLGKFIDRVDRQEQLDRLLDTAYSKPR